MNLILSLLFALIALFSPSYAHAFEISPESVSVLCGALPCATTGGGAAGFSQYVLDLVVTGLEVGIIAAAIATLFISAVQMVMFSTEESTVKDSRTSYIYVITGLSIVGLARWIVRAFSPTETGAQLVNGEIVDSAIGNIITYFKLIIAVSLMVNIVIQAFRLLTSQGQDEQVSKAKSRLIAGFIGAGIIMLANVIVISVLPGVNTTSIIALEIAGIANYIIMIIGFLAVLAIVVAGIMLVVSVDEGLKDKAKSVVKTSVVALIVVLLSYALVTGFIAL